EAVAAEAPRWVGMEVANTAWIPGARRVATPAAEVAAGAESMVPAPAGVPGLCAAPSSAAPELPVQGRARRPPRRSTPPAGWRNVPLAPCRWHWRAPEQPMQQP